MENDPYGIITVNVLKFPKELENAIETFATQIHISEKEHTADLEATDLIDILRARNYII